MLENEGPDSCGMDCRPSSGAAFSAGRSCQGSTGSGDGAGIPSDALSEAASSADSTGSGVGEGPASPAAGAAHADNSRAIDETTDNSHIFVLLIFGISPWLFYHANIQQNLLSILKPIRLDSMVRMYLPDMSGSI